ncbi:MAG TPA: hypothetical protein P5556_00200 [Candidatus Gastranaerophilales bacterium]|nr:hypothetical protein [Candidatus Gastranaerophilales bacterium]
MTVSEIGFQTNILQSIRAQNAFQRTARNAEELNKAPKMSLEEDVKVSISSRDINRGNSVVNNTDNTMTKASKNPYINEIKEFANKYNMADIEDADIQEALRYGTSLFVNHIA